MEPEGSCLINMFVKIHTLNLRYKMFVIDTSFLTTFNMVDSVLYVFPY